MGDPGVILTDYTSAIQSFLDTYILPGHILTGMHKIIFFLYLIMHVSLV